MRCRVIVAHGVGLAAKSLHGEFGFEVICEVGDGLQPVPRGHDLVVRVGLSDLALGIDLVDRELAGPVEVEIGIELIGIEAIDRCGVVLRDMAVAHELADDRAVLGFGQGVVVGLSRPGLGELDP